MSAPTDVAVDFVLVRRTLAVCMSVLTRFPSHVFVLSLAGVLSTAGCASDPEPGEGGGTASASATGTDATDDGDDGGGDDDGSGTTSGLDTGSDEDSSGAMTRGTTSDSGDSSTGSDSGSEGSSTGGVLPFDCDDGQAPVRVVGGGSYDTISEGVEAAPPDAVVQVCPGQYTDNVEIERNVTIHGAGADLVTVNGGTGPTFRTLNSSVTFLRFEGMTLEAGTRGIAVDWPLAADRDPVLEIDGVHIDGVQGIGLQVLADGYLGSVEVLDTSITNTVGGTSTQGPLVGGAIYFERVTAQLTDCTIEGNVAETGAMTVWGADVTFTGGRVVSNTAEQGGGAALITRDFPGLPVAGTLTIENSDWGAGAADENQDTDVDCTSVDDTAGFLGSPANATCSSEVQPCCL